MTLTQISTAGVKDDAVTSGKIPANAVGSSELADNAVDTAAIADQAVTLDKLPHGTSSNDGKFLRANNGADPSFETVDTTTNLGINFYSDSATVTSSTGTNTSITAATTSQAGLMSTTMKSKLDGIATGATNSPTTTINNNADNRVITGSGTSNTLEADANLTFNNSTGQLIAGASGDGYLSVRRSAIAQVDIQHSTDTSYSRLFLQQSSGSGGYFAINKIGTNGSGYSGGSNAAQLWQSSNAPILFATNNTERVRILAGGGITFNGDTAAANALDDYEEGTWTPAFTASAGSSATTNVNSASYTKTGNQVFIICYIEVSSETGSDGGLWMVSGLPFTAKSNNHYFPISVGYWNSLEHSMTYLTGTVQPNETNILFRGIPSGTQSGTTNLSYSTYSQQGAGIILSATYLVP